MTRALIWKEVREQGTVLAALIVLGAAVLVAAAVLLTSPETGRVTELRALTAAGRIGLLMLTVTAGMVVGGTLFAGEREAGTFSFLDRLPGSRWRIWWRKALIGAGLVLAAIAVFLGVAFASGLLDTRDGLFGWVLLIGMVALASYGWGMLGSVFARTSLTACGIGLGFGLLALLILYPLVGIGLTVARRELGLWQYIGRGASIWEWTTLVVGYSLTAIPIPIAAWLFTGPDRVRKLAAFQIRKASLKGIVFAGLQGATSVRWGSSWRRLLWLNLRQLRFTTLALVGASLVAGCALLPEEGVAVAIWPVLGLGIGVLVGVMGMSDEQGSGAFRFWGERRMPTGRLWTAKVAVGLGQTLLLVVVLLVPAIVAAMLREERGHQTTFLARAMRSGILSEPEFPLFTFLVIWPAYGFAFGHLAALLFRKGVVAGAVGLMLGGTFAAFWLPSLLAGGLHHWQVFAAPVVALLTARLLTWSWVTERLGTRWSLTRLAGGAVAVLVLTIVGIGYRVQEVRAVPDIEDDLAFARGLPTFDEKQSGRDLRRAIALLGDDDHATLIAKPAKPLPGIHKLGPNAEQGTYLDQLRVVLVTGWPTDRPDLDAWLKKLDATDWAAVVETASRKPTGVLEDPAELAPDTPLRNLDGMRSMTPLYLARALQKQAAGDPASVPHAVTVWLAVIRTVRNDTLLVPTLVSMQMEWQVYQALGRWLERLDGRPDLLRTALAAVQEHERTDPFDPQSIQFAQQVVVRNAVLAPSRWLPEYFDMWHRGYHVRGGVTSATAETETNLVGFAWAVPWEKERLRRVIGLGNRPGRTLEQHELMRGMPGLSMLPLNDQAFRQSYQDSHKEVVASRRAMILTLALRLHEAETGALPEKLGALVPKYLPAVPADPFDGKPFRYRVSAGEEILLQRLAWPTNPTTSTRIDPFQVLIAVAGSACWPLVQMMEESPDRPQPWNLTAPQPQEPANVLVVEPSQAILWSPGPDGVDSNAAYAIDPMIGQRTVGDLVYLIPRPPKPEEK